MLMKKLRVPNAFIIVFIIMLVAAVMTYVVPAGRYELVKGAKVIDPASFHFVENKAVTLWGFIDSIFAGMYKGAAIIIFTFLMGGYFNVVVETKAIDRFVGYLIGRYSDSSAVIIPAIMVLMSLLGFVGIANPVVAFMPVGLILAKRLKLDRIVAVAVMFVACYTGYSMSAMCPVTVQLAQKIADITILSGFGFRTLGWLLILAPTILYTMRYVRRIQRDASASVMGGDFAVAEDGGAVAGGFALKDALVLAVLAGGMLVYIYGSIAYKWGLNAMVGAMFVIAVIDAAIAGMGPDSFVKAFIRGAQQMCFSALLIGLATSISVILTNGNVLHTIIYAMAQALLLLPHWIVGPVMYQANIVFNFFVPSGSGQAAIVMPIMAPLADVVGLSRQMAICAYQYGDGLSNCIFPTNGTMMACIAVAGVKFDQWLRWMLPLFGIWWVISTLWIIAGVAFGVA